MPKSKLNYLIFVWFMLRNRDKIVVNKHTYLSEGSIESYFCQKSSSVDVERLMKRFVFRFFVAVLYFFGLGSLRFFLERSCDLIGSALFLLGVNCDIEITFFLVPAIWAIDHKEDCLNFHILYKVIGWIFEAWLLFHFELTTSCCFGFFIILVVDIWLLKIFGLVAYFHFSLLIIIFRLIIITITIHHRFTAKMVG